MISGAAAVADELGQGKSRIVIFMMTSSAGFVGLNFRSDSFEIPDVVTFVVSINLNGCVGLFFT